MESIAGFPEGRALLPSELGFRRWGLLPRDLLLSALLPTLRSEKCRERRRQGAESTFSRWQRLIRVWTRGPSPRAALPCPPPGRAQGLPGAEVPEGRERRVGTGTSDGGRSGRDGACPVFPSSVRSAGPFEKKDGNRIEKCRPNTQHWSLAEGTTETRGGGGPRSLLLRSPRRRHVGSWPPPCAPFSSESPRNKGTGDCDQ